MKAYLVLEGADIGPPRDNADIVYGVFLTKEGASECMERHARYMDSLEARKLIRKARKVTDKHGNIYIQILEVELDACRRDTWI